jgi:hypothetical protein
MQHAYIRPRSPDLNGKVKRSHLTAHLEFHRSHECSAGVDLNENLAVWKGLSNACRWHSSLIGLTPGKVLRGRLEP